MKRITHIKCIWPFTRLSVHHHGYCYSCCASWTTIGTVGRLTHNNSLMDIWNNERMQYIRKAVLEDELWKVCNFKYCPYAINNQFLDLEAMKNDDPNFNFVINQIMAGRTIIDKPPIIFQAASSGNCNLKCVMCQSNNNCLKEDNLLDERLFTQIIPEILPDISKLSLGGNGEPLFNQYSRKFLQSLDAKNYPSLKIELQTNGTMFTPKFWESIRHNRYESILVSVDAASKKTYEKIRRNGNWDILRRNLDFISELRRQNIFTFFRISFIVMKSNYREMKDFAELGLKLGCDEIVFQKIFGFADIRENINFTNNKKVFVEIANILTDPIFNRKEVVTTVIDEYRKYAAQSASFWDGFISGGKQRILIYPTKMLLFMSKHFTFLSHIYEFLKKKRIVVKNFDNKAGSGV